MPVALGDASFDLFRACVARPEEETDLLEAALLIAQVEYPHLNRAAYYTKIDEMGREVAGRFATDTLSRLRRINHYLFQELGFHGNTEDYYDPRNSFLNDVIERRTGIPITLSLLYIEVGRRSGLPLAGIGMPGHFLVGCADQYDLFVDAFEGGKLLTRGECIARFREQRPDEAFRPELLAPVGPRYFLTRLLNNLLEIYVRGSRHGKALPMLERVLVLNPDEPEWFLRRATLHQSLKNYALAARDLERYLVLAPDSPERDTLTQQLNLLHHLRGMVN